MLFKWSEVILLLSTNLLNGNSSHSDFLQKDKTKIYSLTNFFSCAIQEVNYPLIENPLRKLLVNEEY